MRQSSDQIVSQLKSKGLAFNEFTLTHEGNYAPEDAEWNYKDVPHLNYVHKAIRDTGSVIESDQHAYINIRNELGIPLPSAVFVYQSRANALTYYTTWFFFVVIIETVYDELGFNRTRVATTYSVGCPRLFRWFLPALRWAITRNYHRLMEDDIPMRERRAQLRAWGYSFLRGRSDFSWEESVDITKPNLRLPESLAFQPQTISVEQELMSNSEERFLGVDDHLGLRVVRSNGHLLIYPRLCPHEGASLDKPRCINRKIVCPWHGRVFQPVASFDLSRSETQHAVTTYHDITLSSGILTVRPKGVPGRPA